MSSAVESRGVLLPLGVGSGCVCHGLRDCQGVMLKHLSSADIAAFNTLGAYVS